MISCGTIPVPQHQTNNNNTNAEIVNETSVSAINPKSTSNAVVTNDVDPVVKQPSDSGNDSQNAVKHEHSAKNTKKERIKKPLTDEKTDQLFIGNIPKASYKRTGKKRFARAQTKYQAGQYAGAVTILEQLIRLFTENPKYRDLLVLTYTKYAQYLENKADLLEAQTVLEKALSIQPYNRNLQKQLKELENRREADLHYAAGLQAVETSQQDKAIDAFNQALNLKPDHELAKKQIALLKIKFVDSYHKKAMVLYRKQKLDEAIKTWGRVLMLDPEHDMAKLYRARAVGLKEKLERL